MIEVDAFVGSISHADMQEVVIPLLEKEEVDDHEVTAIKKLKLKLAYETISHTMGFKGLNPDSAAAFRKYLRFFRPQRITQTHEEEFEINLH